MSTANENNVKVSDSKLSAAIMLSVDVKAAFEMYAYRVISPEIFLERLEDIVKGFNEIAQ